MPQVENYYEIDKKLKNILERIRTVDNKTNFEVYADAQSLFFEYEFLKQEFVNKVQSVYKYTQTKDFKKISKENYLKIKNYVKSILKKRKVEIIYFGENPSNILFLDDIDKFHNYHSCAQYLSIINEAIEAQKNSGLDAFDDNGKLISKENNNWYLAVENTCFNDIPSLLYYESLNALNMKEYQDEIKSPNNLKIKYDLHFFYEMNYGFEIANLINFIKDIEYLIVAMNIGKKFDNANRFMTCIGFSSLYKVISDLLVVTKEKIDETYGFKLPTLPDIDMPKHSIVIHKNEPSKFVTLDGYPIKLNKRQIIDITKIIEMEYNEKPEKVKSYMSTLNKLFTDALSNASLYNDPRPFKCNVLGLYYLDKTIYKGEIIGSIKV